MLKGHDKQSVRLCGNYKITANKAIMTEQYTMPTIKEIFSRLAAHLCFRHPLRHALVYIRTHSQQLSLCRPKDILYI